MSNTVWTNIVKENELFEKTVVKFNPSFAPRQKDIINLVDYYWMSRYQGGDYDSTGYRMSFYNIIMNPVDVASKLVDLDTKDIRIVAEEGQSYYPAWLFGKDLKLWMKENKNKDKKTFGQLLNQIIFNWPKYGHIILKKVKNSIYLVPLQNIVNLQDVSGILFSDSVIEKHDYTYGQLRKMPWDKDLIEYCIAKYGNEGRINVYERQGDVEGMNHNYHIIAEGAKDEEIFVHDTIDRDDLYRELKWDDITGRALGRGQSERLFEAQIAKNRTENLFSAGLRWTSKHIFQTRDSNIAKNLIKQIMNGDVLTINSEITPIPVEERNLAAYNFADAKWNKNIADVSFAYSELSGERPPSGTPLGTSLLQTQMSGQYFDLKREELGLFLKNIIFDWIIPEFKKNRKKTHSLMTGEFNEEELDKIRGLILNNATNKAILGYINKNKKIPSAKEAELLKSVEKEKIRMKREIKIPDNYYEDLKYKIDIIITNEQIDMASRLTTLQTILQIIGSNPTILKEPRTKKVFYKLLDLTGFSPTDFEIEEESGLEETMAGQMSAPFMAERGGSIARPVFTGVTPRTATIPTTL